MTDYAEKLLQEISDSENGFFQLEGKEGDCYLTVYPAGKLGKPVSFADVMLRIQVFGVTEFTESTIKEIVKSASGQETKIGKWNEKEKVDGRVEITVSEDCMQVIALVFPPKMGGKLVTRDFIRSELSQLKIVHGLAEDFFESTELLEFQTPYTVAKGTSPTLGGDGRIEILFDTLGKPNLVEDEKGRVDFREIGIIKWVEKGALLAKLYGPSPGTHGMDVYGREIPFEEGKALNWKIGTGVEIKSDKLYSTLQGRPMIDREGTIRVDEVIHLEAVDFSTGNIDFPGTIIVDEKVTDGFKLTTNGSIVIHNSVGKVFLKAKGSITINGGCLGRGEGVIESGGDIICKFAEQVRLVAESSIYIEEAAMHSQLTANEAVEVFSGRGEIIGGECIAGIYVKCKKLGSVAGTKTKVVIGTDPEILNDIEKLNLEIKERKEVLAKVYNSIQKIEEEASKKNAKPESNEMVPKLKEVEVKYETLLKASEKQLVTLLNSYNPHPESYLFVYSEIFPGVEANLGKGRIFKSSHNGHIGTYVINLDDDGIIQIEKQFSKRS